MGVFTDIIISAPGQAEAGVSVLVEVRATNIVGFPVEIQLAVKANDTFLPLPDSQFVLVGETVIHTSFIMPNAGVLITGYSFIFDDIFEEWVPDDWAAIQVGIKIFELNQLLADYAVCWNGRANGYEFVTTVTLGRVKPGPATWDLRKLIWGKVLSMELLPADVVLNDNWLRVSYAPLATYIVNPATGEIVYPHVIDPVEPEPEPEPEPAPGPTPTYYSLETLVEFGQGYVTRSPHQNAYEAGTAVTLTAHPAAGWEFTQWGGDISGTGETRVITMDSDKYVTLIFAPVSVPAAEPEFRGFAVQEYTRG